MGTGKRKKVQTNNQNVRKFGSFFAILAQLEFPKVDICPFKNDRFNYEFETNSQL